MMSAYILTGVSLSAFFVHCHVNNTHHHANRPALHEVIVHGTQFIHLSLHSTFLRLISLLPMNDK